MSLEFPDDLIFVVRGEKPKPFGTAFLIHSDEQHSYLLTCAHVIDQIGTDKTLFAESYPAEVIASDPKDGYDVAILKIAKVHDKKIYINTTINTGDAIGIAGFFQLGDQTNLAKLTGTLGENGKITSKNYPHRVNNWRILIESDHSLEDGYSGSPAFDQQGLIIGFINQSRPGGRQGQLISIEVIKIIWPEFADKFYNKPKASSHLHLTKDEGDLLNFKEEITFFKSVLEGIEAKTRFIALIGKTGSGKSRLMREYTAIATANYFEVFQFDFKIQTFEREFLDQIVARMGRSNFPNFEASLDEYSTEWSRAKEREWIKKLTRKFFSDLSAFQSSPIRVLLLDHFEKPDREFKTWFQQSFIQYLTIELPLIVVLAGQENLDQIPRESYGQRHFELNGLPVDHFIEYAKARNAPFSSDDISIIHQACDGAPGKFISMIQGRRG